MKVISVARPFSAFLAVTAPIFVAGAVLIGAASGRGPEHSVYFATFGSLTPVLFFGVCLLALVLNFPLWRHRQHYVSIDGPFLNVVGFKPMRLDEITEVEIGRGAGQRPTLRIFSSNRKIPISSLMAKTPLAELRAAIEAARRP